MKRYDVRIHADRHTAAPPNGARPTPSASARRIEPMELLPYLDRRGDGYEGPLALWLTDLAREGRWIETEGV